MKKLIEAYKTLPPEMRILVAMLGLGTPAGIIYVLAKYLHTTVDKVILGLVLVVAVVSIVGFGISRLFGFRSKRRSQRMAADLTSDAGRGPVSMDLRASVKANNDKFTNAIREMRKNLGVSIYDLPWYIVIGDSGCGKTKLINEGGLTFSTGKPEGYQLGTLNYNWWFTEDAIFVDMAGRLCNPQDDGDRREWTAFLETVTKGRPGYPINGAVVCISAEHLLQDAPEKIEQDANTVLERLRDLQSKCGVTFATYLVVTKCDKVLGFMQFFDRAERDITIKNQIFGWSKPGDFNELYDPEKFDQDFNQVYQRLSDLRMRRLADEAEEVELGLAYSFPDEFRAFREPMAIYVRTLFPMIRNPRGVKNLIFRGTYFTSATQQGGLILKHLVERLGAQAAEHFIPLESLYPKPKPHFVKDLLFRKVFPEHGLVFRNEQQVLRNRRLAKMLWVGSGVLGVLLFTVMIWSWTTFDSLMGLARIHVDAALSKVDRVDAFKHVNVLAADADRLEDNPWASRMLSLGFGASKPIEGIRTVQVGLFHKGVLQAALKDVEDALAAGTALKAKDAPADPFEKASKAQAYEAALRQYIAWYAAGARAAAGIASGDLCSELDAMCGIIDNPESITRLRLGENSEQPAFPTLIASCFGLMCKPESPWPHPAALLQGRAIEAQAAIQKACDNLHDYLRRYAALDEQNPNPSLREWARLMQSCGRVESSYRQILEITRQEPASVEAFAKVRDDFRKAYKGDDASPGFAPSLAAIAWNPTPKMPFERLAAAIDHQRKCWQECRKDLQAAAADKPATRPLSGPIAAILGGRPGNDPVSLDDLLTDGLRKADLVSGSMPKDYLDNQPFQGEQQKAQEVFERYGHVLALRPPPKDGHEFVERTPDAWEVARVLSDVDTGLADVKVDLPDDLKKEQLAAWVDQFQRLNPDDRKPPKPVDLEIKSDRWQKAGLQHLMNCYQQWAARAAGTRLLLTIERRLAEKELGPWGLAELEPDWLKNADAPFEYSDAVPVAAPAEPGPQEEEPQQAAPTRRRRRSAPVVETPQTAPVERRKRGAAVAAEASHQLRMPATRNFSLRLLNGCLDLQEELDLFSRDLYFASDAERPIDRCKALAQAAMQQYLRKYVSAWNEAYRRKAEEHAALLKDVLAAATWKDFLAELDRSQRGEPKTYLLMKQKTEDVVEYFLQSTRWLAYYRDGQDWLWLEDGARRPLYDAFTNKEVWTHAFSPASNVVALPLQATTQTPPWKLLAVDVGSAWQALCKGLYDNRDLPSQFTGTIPPVKEIPWGGLARIRDDSLPDEVLTGQLVDVEAHAQDLLSRELSRVLCDIQREHLGEKMPTAGWPMMNDPSRRDDLSTVRLDTFCKFLRQVKAVQQALQPLEEGLKDDLRLQRQKFYKQCKDWSDFLDLTDTDDPKPLGMTVYVDNPLDGEGGIEMRAPNYYDLARLYVGLRRDKTEASIRASHMDIRTVKEAEKDRDRYEWTWPSGTGEEESLYFQLVQGQPIEPNSTEKRPDTERMLLGNLSPLSFPAYLLVHGKPGKTPKEKIVFHAFTIDVRTIDGLKRIKTGVKIVFDLDRPLPEPVQPMRQPSPPPPRVAGR